MLKGGMLDQLTFAAFEPLVGSSFWAEFPNGAKVELRLVSVGKVMESQLARVKRQPFSLFFLGPKTYHLKQQTYRLAHDSFPTFELFLVPVSEKAEGYEYEAVFT
jgi:hypothetical protein